MYQKTAINMRLAKIQAKIYDLESLAFKTTEEVNQLLNEVCELVSVRYREAKASEKKSHNLYSVEYDPAGLLRAAMEQKRVEAETKKGAKK